MEEIDKETQQARQEGYTLDDIVITEIESDATPKSEKMPEEAGPLQPKIQASHIDSSQFTEREAQLTAPASHALPELSTMIENGLRAFLQQFQQEPPHSHKQSIIMDT